MGVVSNIGFVDRTGASVPEFMAAVHLNQITNVLPWQIEVVEATRRVRAAQPWSDRIRMSRDRARAIEGRVMRSRSIRQPWRATS
jgi:hypothetical protein